MHTWQLQEAKARLSELVRAATKAPQVITVRGKEEVVVMSKEDYAAVIRPEESLFDFLRKSPLRGMDLDVSRNPSKSRPAIRFDSKEYGEE
jgi:antitoxin Phd